MHQLFLEPLGITRKKSTRETKTESLLKLNKEFKVGIFAIGTIAMFYLGFNYLKGIDFFSRTNRYYVIYDNVGGLLKSNPVKISGFNVGRVAAIKLLQKEASSVLVTLDIDKDIILGDSAEAILDVSLLGDVAIVITVGDITRPINPGDTLRARSDPGLTQMLVESTQPITDNLPATIANLNGLLEDLQGTGDTLKIALASFARTSDRLNLLMATNQDNIAATIENFKKSSASLNESIKGLKPLLSKLNILADSLNNVDLAQTLDKINLLIDQTTKSTEALGNRESTLGKLLYEDSLYNNLNNTLLDLDTLLNNINSNPKHFFAPLGKSSKKIERDRAKQQQ